MVCVGDVGDIILCCMIYFINGFILARAPKARNGLYTFLQHHKEKSSAISSRDYEKIFYDI
jgi:hypothetical protein